MHYVDKDRIIDYIEALPTKTIILEVPKEIEQLNWQLFKTYSEKINFILCLANLQLVEECQKHNIKYYWGYPINSYYELEGMLKLNPSYLLLGAPLCFDLENIRKRTNIPIRLVPNVAYDAYIPREDGICGQWVRPEDVKYYEPYVEVFEFDTNELQREAVLLHVYKDNENWPGNLNLLITNLNWNIDNRNISPEVGPTRLNCKQRCMSHGSCHVCPAAFKYSPSEQLKEEN